MSDDIFEVLTPYNDVAELGQGYIDRADGERMLLALPRVCDEGEGVRFIVHLADGTPAFAGAGRCVQVSDQGGAVAPEQRYETLLDALAFDERSQPVYDYIVAVRQMAYAEATGQAGDQPGEEAVYESEEPAPFPDRAGVEISPPADSQAPVEVQTEYEVDAPAAVETDPRPAPLSERPPSERPFSERPPSERPLSARPLSARPRSERPLSDRPLPQVPTELTPEVLASVLPEPLPRGMLQRPAIAAHWAPAAPRAPRPSDRPSRFRYSGGKLPIPEAPPRPELDPSQWVQPAPRP